MRLVIVSHTPHYGRLESPSGLGSTVREIDHLSTMFDSVCHVAPLHPGNPPQDSSPYRAGNVRLRAVHPAGGETLLDKAMILTQYPAYAKTIREEIALGDAVHVRCPANIALCALVVLKAMSWRGPLWIKYAGSWIGYPGEPLSYRTQRRWLNSNWRHACVTTNGVWPNQPPHVHSLYNPCLTDAELAAAGEPASGRSLQPPVRLLFVGRLDADKGVPQLIATLRGLDAQGLPFEAELAGDGPSRESYERDCDRFGLAAKTKFLGWLSRSDLNAAYRRAHLLILPSRAEGWPKVLSEAMAYGVVPIASRVGSIPQNLEAFGIGHCLDAGDTAGFARAVATYATDPVRWERESGLAAKAAGQFSYSAYLESLKRLQFARGSTSG